MKNYEDMSDKEKLKAHESAASGVEDFMGPLLDKIEKIAFGVLKDAGVKSVIVDVEFVHPLRGGTPFFRVVVDNSLGIDLLGFRRAMAANKVLDCTIGAVYECR